MLSYKDNQALKLSYDVYHDTELDNAGDQLVDFSRRYPDNIGDQLVDFSQRYPENDTEEACHRPSVKNSQQSLTTRNCEESKIDELKFFCDEGTPGMPSSASSLSDLREAGKSISEDQTRKDFFLPQSDFSAGIIPNLNHTENCVDTNLVVGETKIRELNNEEEYINPEATKASTPIVFSRSSSIGSLNSFEQHSIVDDRSSVSAFSNLASGLISPSEIPDSPCGLESPCISKSRPNEFIFPNNNKPGDHEHFKDEVLGDLVDHVKVFDDEGDCPSVSNLSALSIQADSHLHLSLSSSIPQVENKVSLNLNQNLNGAINCPITDEETDFVEQCQNLKICDESYIQEQNCFKTIPNLPSDVKDVNQSDKSQSTIETKYEDKGTSTSEDFNFHDHNYKWGSFSLNDMEKFISISMKERQCLQQNEDKQIKDDAQLHQMVKEFTALMAFQGCDMKPYLLQNKSSNYSKDNSDEESSGILEEYGLNEIPRQEDSMFNDSKQSVKLSFETSGSSLKEDIPNTPHSEDDISDDDDDDDGILNECVLLGMPQKSDNVQVETENISNLEATSSNNITISKPSISNDQTHQFRLFDDAYQSTLKDTKEDLANDALVDDDSDIDESDLLVQQCIQLGRSELRNLKAPVKTKPCVIPPSNKALGSRDNWPDGVSDGEDDDDDILSEIIKAGKPDSNSQTDKSPYAGSKPCLKFQNQRKLTAAEDRALYLNKDYSNTITNYGNIPKEIVPTACTSANALIGIDDSTYVYRTEDTPILSPSASLSDLSTLSFTEDKVCQESFLNNSRNSDCSSDSEDDEMLLQCIRQGMPVGRRVVA